MATSVMGVMKMGNIVPRVGIKPISLAFWAIDLTITPSSDPDPRLPIYVPANALTITPLRFP